MAPCNPLNNSESFKWLKGKVQLAKAQRKPTLSRKSDPSFQGWRGPTELMKSWSKWIGSFLSFPTILTLSCVAARNVYKTLSTENWCHHDNSLISMTSVRSHVFFTSHDSLASISVARPTSEELLLKQRSCTSPGSLKSGPCQGLCSTKAQSYLTTTRDQEFMLISQSRQLAAHSWADFSFFQTWSCQNKIEFFFQNMFSQKQRKMEYTLKRFCSALLAGCLVCYSPHASTLYQ